MALRSNVSQNSTIMISQFTDSLIDQTHSDTDLVKLVGDLKAQVRVLTLENEILERVIMRLDPSLMNGVAQAMDYAAKMHQTSSSLNVGSLLRSQTSRYSQFSASPSRAIFSPSKISVLKRGESSAKFGTTATIFGAGPKVNVLERSELVSTEMQIVINVLEKARNKAAKQHALLKAQLEEIEIKVVDLNKAREMFKQEVIIGGWDKIAQRIPAEIWIRFMTEWVKMCDSQIGKLRLRTSTLNTQFSKLKGQIKAKAELSDALRPVDFEKLRIENQVSEEEIENMRLELGELKKMTGEANLNLTVHKKELMAQNNYLISIINTIKRKEKQKQILDKERVVIKDEADSLAIKLEETKKVRLAYEVPDVMDYVRVKAELTDLKNNIKLMENRSHVQQIALASLHKKLHTMMSSNAETGLNMVPSVVP